MSHLPELPRRNGIDRTSSGPLLDGAAILALVLMLTGAPAGCDLLGRGGGSDAFDAPPERLVAMTAVYEETLEGGRPIHRLVVADVENPATYKVLRAAGNDVGRSCFSPEKRRLLFEDHSASTLGSRAAIKLLDLKTREVGDLGATGTLKGCVWRPDGSGFYYAANVAAGLMIAHYYDLETGEARPFAQAETQNGALRGSIPYGRKGRDSILVLADSLIRGANGGWTHAGGGYYFVDAETGEYLTQIENERIKGPVKPAYNEKQGLIAFLGNSKIIVSDLEGSFFETYSASPRKVYYTVRWGPRDTVLAGRRPQASFEPETYHVIVADIGTGTVRELVAPERIDGAVGLRAPDY